MLLIVSALLALDALIAAVGWRRGWYRPVAWLAPTLTVSGAILFSALLLPSFGEASLLTLRRFVDLDLRLDEIGLTAEASRPLITDTPIWLPYTHGGTALALPYESPSSVLDLARRFHAPAVVTLTGDHPFRAAIATGDDPAAGCFAAPSSRHSPARTGTSAGRGAPALPRSLVLGGRSKRDVRTL